MLTARHALHPALVRVRADQRPPAVPQAATVYAVFAPDEDPTGQGRFLGLVTPGEIASFRERIFADLLPRPAPAPVAAHLPLHEIAERLDRERIEAVAVIEGNGAFLGAVTRGSLLSALLRDTPAAALRGVAEAVSAPGGEHLFHNLVLGLAQALGVDYAFVGAVSPRHPETIETLAFCDHGSIAENIEYRLAPATPCGSLGCRVVCHFPEGVRELYPEDETLRAFNVEAFIGHPLLDAAGKVLGLLAIMHSRPLADPQRIQFILQLSAARAAAELERRQAAVLRRMLASAVEQTADSVLITDREGVIEYLNAAFERTTGYSRAEALGKKPNLVKSGHHPVAFYQRLWATIQRGAPFHEVFVNRRKNGELYYEEKTITPLLDEKGNITHFVSTGKDISERMAAERALAKSTAEWAYATDFMEDPLYLVDLSDKVVRANRAFYRFTGLRPENVIGRDITSLMHPQGERVPCPVCRARRERQDADIVREADDPTNPTGRPLETRIRVVRAEGGEPTGVLVTFRDLSPMRQAEAALRASEASLRQAQRIAHLGDWDWNIVANELRWSDEIYCIFGLAPRQFAATYEAFLERVHPLDRQRVIEAVNKALNERAPYSIDHRIVRPDGTERIVHEEAEVSFDQDGRPVRMIGTVQDITEHRQAMDRLHYLANYDTLTGLPNRVLLQDRLNQAMLEADRRDRLVAVMFLDLDRFKLINDTLGHETGDALLKQVAERLRTCVRTSDTISRLGGDEFTIVLANVAHVNDVAHVAQKIIDCFAVPFHLQGRELFISPSIGITLYPFDDNDLDSLLRNADAAMYHAKELGRNTFQFYTAELNRRTAKRLQLETALRHALERNELLLHYQPQLSLKSGRIIGAEALARWRHPEMGLVSPQEFIPLAEETGLILPIGEWVLRTACTQARAWHAAGFGALQIAVNLSGRQFQHRHLAKLVKQVLHDTGLDPRLLDLELTESLLMHNTEAILGTMEELHAYGVSFSMDDFGTGYSSLSYLKRFPIDTLKIDQSFMRDIPRDPDDAAIAQAIIAMAHSLDIRVIAEGVETARQLAFLRAKRCDGMQGFLFSKPLPAKAFTALLRRQRRLPPARRARRTTR
jgi:diguanylate cyclase (GGDEF)-like protein/PAS domain S-box-containing protein